MSELAGRDLMPTIVCLVQYHYNVAVTCNTYTCICMLKFSSVEDFRVFREKCSKIKFCVSYM